MGVKTYLNSEILASSKDESQISCMLNVINVQVFIQGGNSKLDLGSAYTPGEILKQGNNAGWKALPMKAENKVR